MSTKVNEVAQKQTTMPLSDHRVVVFGVPDEDTALRNLLMKQIDMDAVTVQLTLRSLPGLLPGLLPQEQAASIATAIRALGLSAVAVPESEVPNLSQAHQIHHLRATDKGLEIMDICDHQRLYLWDEIRTLSVGVVPSTAPGHVRPASALAMGSSHRSWSEGVHIRSKKRPEAFVVLNTGTAFLLASDEMNYEYLGSRLGTSSTINFSRLINDLVERSASAWITPSARAFLDRGPVRHYEFRSRDDFRYYTEFQTLLSGQVKRRR